MGSFALTRCLLCSWFSRGHWGGWARTRLSGARCSGSPQPLWWARRSLVLLEDGEEVATGFFSMILRLGEGSCVLS